MRLVLPLTLFLSALGCYDLPVAPETVDPDGADPIDLDGDGAADSVDCDDTQPDINPSATELCNGVDDDCDGQVDEDGTVVSYRDVDGDGYGDEGDKSTACTRPDGYVALGGDCDDAAAEVNPAAAERCDGSVDENCDGSVDETGAEGSATFAADLDGDGFGDPNNTRDECEEPDGYVLEMSDCDDTDASINPGGQERCDGAGDENCNGEINEAEAVDTRPFGRDSDADGYGDASFQTLACAPPAGFVDDASDCDDGNARVSPAAEERCDTTVDDDCDGEINEDDSVDAPTWYIDNDLDGHGDPSNPTLACELPGGAAANSDDCDDDQAAVSPSNEEWCDGLDNNCDGTVDFGTTLGADYTNLQSALDAAPSDPICMPTGTYELTAIIQGGAKIELQGMGEPEETVLKGPDPHNRPLSVGERGTEVVVSNLTLTGGSGAEGTGAAVYGGSLTLRNVLIDGFTAASSTDACNGAAVWNNGGALVLENVEITNGVVACSDVLGLVSAVNGTIEVQGLSVVDNDIQASQAMRGVVNITDSSGFLDNVIVAGNSVEITSPNNSLFQGVVGFFSGSSSTLALRNWTVTRNDLVVAYTGMDVVWFWNESMPLQMVNLHVDTLGWPGNGVTYFGCDSSRVGTLDYSNLSGFDDPFPCGGGSTTSSVNQASVAFVDTSGTVASDWDLHLDTASPLIDAGDPGIKDADGSRSDIGAYGGPGSDW